MSSSFEGFFIDDILNCPEDMNAAGLKTRLYYAPSNFFKKIELPSVLGDTNFKNILEIQENGIEFQEDLEWSYIDVLIDENELKSMLSGSQQKKKTKIELEIFVLGLESHILGFLEMHKNTPFVFGVPDANGNSWIVGNLRNRAFIDSADASTQKKYEDNAGVAIKINCKSTLYLFKGSVEYMAKRGDFNKDFNNDFFI